jgi:Na+-transporting methylmalonyl-CoA/oxaloacetate decarboxylase gamma subunit
MVENPWITVLMITVLGMGLLFLALAFFYGLLLAMARGLQDRAAAPVEQPALAPADADEEESRLQAAAVAIALARTARQSRFSDAPAVEHGGSRAASPWWSLHHQRRLASGAPQGRGQ